MLTTNLKTALFIDGANLYASSKQAGFDVDYKRILGHFDPMVANYYTAIEDDEDFTPLRPLVDWIAYNGYVLTTKPLKKFINNGVEKVRGSMAVDIAVDALEISPHVDRIVLFSGDGDLTRMVAAVQRRGVHAVVVSEVSITSDELRRQANTFINLKDLENFISKPPKSSLPSIKGGLGKMSDVMAEANGNK